MSSHQVWRNENTGTYHIAGRGGHICLRENEARQMLLDLTSLLPDVPDEVALRRELHHLEDQMRSFPIGSRENPLCLTRLVSEPGYTEAFLTQEPEERNRG